MRRLGNALRAPDRPVARGHSYPYRSTIAITALSLSNIYTPPSDFSQQGKRATRHRYDALVFLRPISSAKDISQFGVLRSAT